MKAPVKTAARPAGKASAKTAVKTPAKPAPKATATKAAAKKDKPLPKAVVKAAAKAPTKPPVKPVATKAAATKPVPKAAAKPAPKPAPKPSAVKPAAAKPVAPVAKAPVAAAPKPAKAKAKGQENMADYRPTDDEDFMNDQQRAYFRRLLESWKAEILSGAKQTINNLQDESGSLPDIVDRAASESDKALELRTRDRQRKLIAKIDAAIRRIDDGTYGFCEATGEPIGLRRLEARPTATLSLEAQERHERKERTLRDD